MVFCDTSPSMSPVSSSWKMLVVFSRYLSVRGRDVLDMIGAKLLRTCKVSAEETDICAEISRGFQYASMHNGLSPGVCPTGLAWVFSRWRWTIGRESLALQGFPVDEINFDYLSEKDIQGLA